jgi:hypothetical protein
VNTLSRKISGTKNGKQEESEQQEDAAIMTQGIVTTTESKGRNFVIG